jgi:PAS domain S-box-containing protein
MKKLVLSLPIKKKLLFLSCVAIVGLLISTLITVSLIVSQEKESQQRNIYLTLKTNIETARIGYNAIRGDIFLLYMLNPDTEKKQIDEANQHYREFLTLLQNAQKELLNNSKSDSDLYSKVQYLSSEIDIFIGFTEKNKSAIANFSVEKDTLNTVKGVLINEFNPIFDKILEAKNGLVTALDQKLEQVEKEHEYNQRFTFWLIILFALIILIVVFLTSIYIGNQISTPVMKIRDTLDKISTGELPVIEESRTEDEVGQMQQSLKKLIDNLENVKVFTEDVGRGNFTNKAVIFNNKGDIAHALLNMATNLKNATETEKKRNWITEGLAEAGKIIRSDNNDIEQVADATISFVVKYISANQGSLFLLNEENSQLELIASWAYNRKKHLLKTVDVGEGLIGQACLEKEMIYLREIPENYIKITSGLGEALPRNLIILPLVSNGLVQGVIEIASFQTIEPYQIDFLNQFGELCASDMASFKVNARTQELLQLSQQQAEDMRAAEEELRQNMEEMQATQDEMQRKSVEMQGRIEAIDNSGIAAIEFDMKGYVLNANPSFLTLMGYSLDEIVGKHHRIFVNSAFAKSEDYEHFWENLASGLAQQGEFERITKLGEKVILFGSYSIIRNNEGHVERVLKLATDITANKVQINQLQAQEEEIRQNMEEMEATRDEMHRNREEVLELLKRFELASATTTEGLWDMIVPKDLDFKDETPFFWTQNFRKMLGYENETDFPNILSSWSNLLHAEHKQKTLEAFTAHLMDFTGNTPYDVQYQLKLKNGVYKWFRAVGNTLRDETGKPLRVAGSLIDIEYMIELEALKASKSTESN